MTKTVAAFLATSLLIPLSPSAVLADGKHTLVLKSEGNADGKVRAQIDSALLKIAKSNVEGVTPGDMSFGDAAAAVGCNPDAPSCATDVIGMLSVDEIISARVTRKPGGLEVVVRRAPKSGPPTEATAKITDAQDALFAPQLAALFGGTTPKPVEPAKPVETPPKPAEPPKPVETPPVAEQPPPVDTQPPPPTEPPQPLPALPPPPEDQQHTRLELAGMIGGGGLVLLGIIMWGQAAGTQSDIDSAPNRTVTDLQHLQDLEKQGDGQAALGNLLFVGGVVLAGVSTYFFIRDRRNRSSAVAHIAPTVFPHGAGIALTFGGTP